MTLPESDTESVFPTLIRIQESQINMNPHKSGSETLLANVTRCYLLLGRICQLILSSASVAFLCRDKRKSVFYVTKLFCIDTVGTGTLFGVQSIPVLRSFHVTKFFASSFAVEFSIPFHTGYRYGTSLRVPCLLLIS